MSAASDRYDEVVIEADPALPIIRITRDFNATAAQVHRAHVDPELFVRWIGPADLVNEIVYWDARDGGSWRYIARRDGAEFGFRGCFHTVAPDRIIQTFSFDGAPDHVALETATFTDLADGRSRLVAQSLCASLEERDQWLASGMEGGVIAGYQKLDNLLAEESGR